MKKKLIVAAWLVLVLVAVIPFFSGIIMERIVKKTVEDFNLLYGSTPIGYSCEIVSYDRGYFSTDLVMKLDMGILKDIYGVESVVFKEHARHGYLGVVSTTSLDENVWYNSFVNDRVQGQDPLHIKTYYSPFGDIETTIILDEFSTSIKDEDLHVKKGEFVIDSDKTLQNIGISIDWQGFDIGQKLSLGKVSGISDMEMISNYIWDGSSDIVFKSLKISDKNADFEISDMKVESYRDADRDANTLASDTHITISSIQSKSKKIDDASARFALKGVNLDVFEEFMNIYFQLISQLASNVSINDASRENAEIVKKQMTQIGLKMIGAYEKLLKEGLEMQISDLQFKLPEGEVKAGITLRLLKDMTFAQFMPVINEPQMLLDIIYLESAISLPVKLVGENQRMLEPAFPEMQTGLFIKEGDYLVSRMETKDGNLYINGNVVPLDKLPQFGGTRPKPQTVY
ncbi:DUF945 family protein [Thermodesulfobacteriota bacterium]